MKQQISRTELNKSLSTALYPVGSTIEVGYRFVVDEREWVAIQPLPDSACFAVLASKLDELPERWENASPKFRKTYIKFFDPLDIAAGTEDVVKKTGVVLNTIRDIFPEGIEVVPDESETEISA